MTTDTNGIGSDGKVPVYGFVNGIKTEVDRVPAEKWTDPISGDTYSVPVGYNPLKTVEAFAAYSQIPSSYNPSNIANIFYAKMLVLADNYKAGGAHELQRTALDGSSYGGFVEDFTPIASVDFGLAASTLGLGSLAVRGGGAYNTYKWLKGENVTMAKDFLEFLEVSGNNPANVAPMQQGVALGDTYTPLQSQALCKALDAELDKLYKAYNGFDGLNFNDLMSLLEKAAKAALDALGIKPTDGAPWDAIMNILKPQNTDPLVIDLNGDGFSLIGARESAVHQDFAGDGYAERVAWVKPTDGLLALDRNNNSKIDGFSELFGNASTDGFDVLRTLDANKDSKISAADAANDNAFLTFKQGKYHRICAGLNYYI